MACHKCHQLGHWTALCPQDPRGSRSSAKPSLMMVQEDWSGLLQPVHLLQITIIGLEPRVQLDVAGRSKNFFVDTGATYSVFFFFLIFIFTLCYFAILYWFCHTLTWIHHGCTCIPKQEPPSHLPPHNIPLGHPSPCISPKHAVSFIGHRLVIRFLHDSIHVSMPFSQIIPPSPSPSESKSPLYTSVSFLLSCIQGHHCHLSKFHIYVLVYCIGVFLSGLLHSV